MNRLKIPIGRARSLPYNVRMRFAAWLQDRFSPVVFLVCVAAILTRVWVAEDAYITFRAVENLFRGLGLVYNPGENIEVFTHPLWMMCLVVIRGVGLPLHFGSIALGLCFSAAALALLVFRETRSGTRVFPFAALALCSISGFRDFATAGMEFSLVFLLLVLLLRELERGVEERPAWIATLLGLLYLTRPELALLVPYYGLFLLVDLARSLRRSSFALTSPGPRLLGVLAKLLAFGLPLLLLCGSYHAFRFFYYNDLFPNTYYAKSGLDTNYTQGVAYLFHTILWAPALWLLIALTGLLPALQSARRLLPARQYLAFVREVGAGALVALYVVRVGGDFMSFRFLLPSITILTLTLDRFFHGIDTAELVRRCQAWLVARGRELPAEEVGFAVRGGVIALFVALLFWPVPYAWGTVADERQGFTGGIEKNPISLFYAQNYPWGKTGRAFGHLQQCLGYPDFWITNSQAQARCMAGVGLGYFGQAAGPGVKILDEQGLPNREIATAPVLVRWRAGHEHIVTFSEALRRRVLFCSTGEVAYDRVMNTGAGVLVHLDPYLLATVPDIEERLKQLSDLKKQGSAVIPRLEARYGVSVEELGERAETWARNEEFARRRSCWREFEGDLTVFFF